MEGVRFAFLETTLFFFHISGLRPSFELLFTRVARPSSPFSSRIYYYYLLPNTNMNIQNNIILNLNWPLEKCMMHALSFSSHC